MLNSENQNHSQDMASYNRPKFRKSAGLFRVLGLVIVVALVFSAWYFKDRYIGLLNNKVIHADSVSSQEIDMSLFWKVLDLVDETYIDRDDITQEDLLYGAISGMVEALGDPYTSFYTPEENTEFKDSLEGVYGGIGAQLGFKDEQLVIIAPLEGTPADQAGLKAGDIIIAVDGELTDKWSLAKAVSIIRGEPGTDVILTLPNKQVTVTRNTIKIPAVRLSWLEGNNSSGQKIAHMRVLRFGSDTIDEWSRLVREVKGQQKEGIILDLRNNPGGLLNAAIYLASDFFRSGVVVEKETKRQNTVYKVDHACQLCDDDVVVLINGGSASASEILAGAIQRRNRGKIVGETSFGKGSVQESIELEDNAAVHITNARWLLPDGQNITEQGLKPDYSEEAMNPSGPFGDGEGDMQLEKAIELLSSGSNEVEQ